VVGGVDTEGASDGDAEGALVGGDVEGALVGGDVVGGDVVGGDVEGALVGGDVVGGWPSSIFQTLSLKSLQSQICNNFPLLELITSRHLVGFA